MSRELLKRALDALVTIEPLIQGWGFTNQNITDAIKAELAKPEDEPVAEVVFVDEYGVKCLVTHAGRLDDYPVGTKFYALPPYQQEPLSGVEIELAYNESKTGSYLSFAAGVRYSEKHLGIGGDK